MYYHKMVINITLYCYIFLISAKLIINTNLIKRRITMSNKVSDPNARRALSMMKLEIANELGYDYNQLTDKVESNAPQNNLDGVGKNVLAGEQVGGMMTKNLVAMGEQALLDKYNNEK